jgi:hypothetical protein
MARPLQQNGKPASRLILISWRPEVFRKRFIATSRHPVDRLFPAERNCAVTSHANCASVPDTR